LAGILLIKLRSEDFSMAMAEDTLHPGGTTAAIQSDDRSLHATELAAERARHAESIIRGSVYLSAASGLIPIPIIDAAATLAVDIRMLAELSDVYKVEFRKDVGKSSIGAFLGVIGPSLAGKAILGSTALNWALASTPMLGFFVRLVTQPALHGAFTYALGKVYQQHFASGGTFLTFRAEKVTGYFREKFDEARNDITGQVPNKA
jgi:uncharacterized protein (DUF697 family)